MIYDNILLSLGLSQSMAQTIVVLTVVTIGIGLLLFFFWKFIAIGGVVVAVIAILSQQPQNKPEPVEVSKTLDAKEIIVEPDPKEVEYVDRCTELTRDNEMCKENYKISKTEDQTVELVAFEPRKKKSKKVMVEPVKVVEQPASKVVPVNLLDVDNEEYKARRASALAKPNAALATAYDADSYVPIPLA